MQPIKDSACFDQMAIVEKYERVISYLYPIAQSIPRKHGVARDMFLQCLMGVPDTLVQAGKSNQVSKTLRRRRTACSSAVLGALSGFDQVFNKAPARDITSVNCRSWGDVGGLAQAQKSTRAVWITTLRYLAATGTTAQTPVRAARTGTTLPRTRTTTSGLALSVTTYIQRSANAPAWQADQSTCGQPALSCFGKYISGFGITPSRKSKSAADFFMPKNTAI